MTAAGGKPWFLHPLGINKTLTSHSFVWFLMEELFFLIGPLSIWWGGGLRLAHCINCSASLLVSRLLQTHHQGKDPLPRPNILDTRIVHGKRDCAILMPKIDDVIVQI